MSILFVIVFIVLYEIVSMIGGVVMAMLPNWIVYTMCIVSIGMFSAYLTKKIFSKKRISKIALYICLLAPIIGTVLNLFTSGFNLSMLWYNIIGCVAVYIGLFEFE